MNVNCPTLRHLFALCPQSCPLKSDGAFKDSPQFPFQFGADSYATHSAVRARLGLKPRTLDSKHPSNLFLSTGKNTYKEEESRPLKGISVISHSKPLPLQHGVPLSEAHHPSCPPWGPCMTLGCSVTWHPRSHGIPGDTASQESGETA